MLTQTKSASITSVNPATGEVLRQLECASEEDVRSAVQRARAAQPAWRELGVAGRVKIVRRFQSFLQEKKSENMI